MSNDTVTINPANPEDVGRALVLLNERIRKAEEAVNAAHARAEAARCVLVGLVMALGQHRRMPFVAHSEIEIALLSLRTACGERPEFACTLDLATQLLDLYHGKLPPEDSPERPLLRLVQNATPEDPAG